jgi:four helix bundle protein
MIKSFLDLRSWQESHKLALEIYGLTNQFPEEERYGLISQMRRAAVSVPSNIAEGMGRSGSKELIRFMINARGSIQELLYQILLAKDLGFIGQDEYDNLTKRFNGLNAGLNAHISSLSRYKY